MEKFFEDEVKEKVAWVDSPWDKIGYLDLVKYPTTSNHGQ